MTLLEACELIVDCPHTTAPDEGQGYPLIRTPNIGKGRLILDGVHRVSLDVYNKRNERAVPQENDLILAREAPVGNVAIIKKGQEVCLGQRTVLIRPNPSIVDPDYLVYYLLSPQIQHVLLSSSNGATVSHLNMSNIRGLEVEFPDMDTQKKTGSFLCTIADKIAVDLSLNEKLIEQAQALFQGMFSEKEPNGKIGDILLENAKSKHKVGDARNVKGIYPFYTSGQAILEFNEALVDGKNIYLNTGGNADVKYYIGKAAYSTDTWCVYGEEYTDYLFVLLSSMINEMNSVYFEGSALKHLQKKKLKDREIYIPTDDEILKFNDLVDPLFRLLMNNINEIKQLESMRDLLLPKLVDGEVDLSECDI